MIKEHSGQVRKILEDYPKARDNDDKLFALFTRAFFINKYSEAALQTVNAEQFLRLMYKSELPNYETIGRCRRMLQEKHAELRGKMYYQRRGLQEQVKEELGYPVKSNEPELFTQTEINFNPDEQRA